MPNQTVKNSLDEIVPNEIFSQKENHVPIKKFLELIQSYQNVPFSGTKWHICPEQIFFGTNHYYYSHLPVGLFHCAKFTKNSDNQSKFVKMPHFWGENGPFVQNNSF